MDIQTTNLQKGVSNLVTTQMLKVLKQMKCGLIKQRGRTGFGLENFEISDFVNGFTVKCMIQGVASGFHGETISESDAVAIDRTTISLTARPQLRFQTLMGLTTTEEMFLTNPKLVADEITLPALRCLRNKCELSDAQNLAEHCPIMPADNFYQDQVITPVQDFAWDHINMLRKNFVELGYPVDGYKLNLNNNDYTLLGNKMTYIQSQDQMVGSAIRTGDPIPYISGFRTEYSTFFGPHFTMLTDAQKAAPAGNTFKFKELPRPGGNHTCELWNSSSSDISLRAGDVLYHLAGSRVRGDGIHWWQADTFEPLYDTRFSFCITSEAYLDRFTELVALGLTTWKHFNQRDVYYLVKATSNDVRIYYKNTMGVIIPDDVTHKISISHTPMTSGAFQNCSRPIKIKDHSEGADEFIVLGDHRKNFLTNPQFCKFKGFTLQAPDDIQHSRVSDPVTGLKVLVSKKGNFYQRRNEIDTSTFYLHGAYAPNLGLLPTAINTSKKEVVNLVGKSTRR